jgi:gag-polypeptide of LTR copia-type
MWCCLRRLQRHELRAPLPSAVAQVTQVADKSQGPKTTLRAWLGARDNPREMRARLHARYASASPSTRVTFHKRVAGKRPKTGGNTVDRISALERLYAGLEAVGDDVLPGQSVATLMGSLGPECDAAVTELRTTPDEPSWDDVAARLQDEYEGSVSAGSDRNAELTFPSSAKQQRQMRGPKCFECGKHGHLRRNSTE